MRPVPPSCSGLPPSRATPSPRTGSRRLYANGVAVKADSVQAAKWHLLARGAGVSDFSLDIVLSKLTPEDRAKAEEAAENWRGERLND